MMSYCTTAMLAIGLLASAPEPVRWQTDYTQALEATRDDGQPLVVVLDDPASGQDRFPPGQLSDGVASGANSDLLRDYHRCHVDVTTEYGKRVARAFQASDFPFTAIIDKTGSVIIYSKAGQMADSEWQKVLKTHRAGERPSASATSRVSYKLDQDSYKPATGVVENPNYCPSCQRRSM